MTQSGSRFQTGHGQRRKTGVVTCGAVDPDVDIANQDGVARNDVQSRVPAVSAECQRSRYFGLIETERLQGFAGFLLDVAKPAPDTPRFCIARFVRKIDESPDVALELAIDIRYFQLRDSQAGQ